MKLISGAFKLGVVAAAAYGVYTLFKDEIRETGTYQQLNEKYDVDNKVEKATAKVKDTMKDTAKTVTAAAKTAKEKATEMLKHNENTSEEAGDDFDDSFFEEKTEETEAKTEDTEAKDAENPFAATITAAQDAMDKISEASQVAEDKSAYEAVSDAVTNIDIE